MYIIFYSYVVYSKIVLTFLINLFGSLYNLTAWWSK